MPSRKIYLGKIRNSSPLMEKIANRPVLEKKKPMEVNLEGEWKGTLQLDSRRANVWAKILDHLQRTNRPVYVEIDNDTNIITKFLKFQILIAYFHFNMDHFIKEITYFI